MSVDSPENKDMTNANATSIRRRFLKRASAGALIVSIPGRSAWAGIANSIVASGHGSDFNQGNCTHLKTVDYFNNDHYRHHSFNHVFGGKPFNRHGSVSNNDRNFGQIFDAYNKRDTVNDNNQNKNKRGINNVNVGIVLMYLNALKHNHSGIYYPVLALHHNDHEVFASYLYNSAVNNADSVGTLLNQTIATYSNGSTC